MGFSLSFAHLPLGCVHVPFKQSENIIAMVIPFLPGGAATGVGSKKALIPFTRDKGQNLTFTEEAATGLRMEIKMGE